MSGRANRLFHWFNRMNATFTTVTSTIAPAGVPYLRDTEASGLGRRRSLAMAKTPRDPATAAPTPTARMSRNTTISSTLSIVSDP